MTFLKKEENYIMIYNSESGLLYGITENCETNFGISSELVYGH